MRSAPTLACELRASRIELVSIASFALAASLAPWAAPLDGGVRLALCAAALVAAGLALRARRRREWNGLSLAGTGAAVLRHPGHGDRTARLEHATVLGPLVVLELACEDGRRLRLPLYPDSTDRDSLRRLRVLLRHGWRAEAGAAIR